jgi:hypothetical protein
MRRWKKILLVFVALILVSQIPFACRCYKLGRLKSAIDQLSAQRVGLSPGDRYSEYKGVFHVHSFLGGHTAGSFEELINAAISNQLNFVVMTEHPAKNFNTSAMTLQGVHGGVLFINGNEVTTANSDRLLLVPGDESANTTGALNTTDVASQAKARGSLSIVAYPEEFKSWDSTYDGIEIYNVYTNTKKINPFLTFFDGLWSYRSYPDLMFATFYSRPDENLKQWDAVVAGGKRHVVAIAGNDAHSNVGFSLNDSSGKTIVGFKLDPYERSFHLVRVHALVPTDQAFDQASLLAAILAGHCFIGFDLFGDSSGFRFTASNEQENKIQGDDIKLEKGVLLKTVTPIKSRIVLFKNGSQIRDVSEVTSDEFRVTESGSYRVEVYLPQLGAMVGTRPWIISNAVNVR